METTPTLGHSNEVGGSEGAREIMEEEVEGVVEDVEGEVESKGERVEKVEGGVEGVKGGVERVVEEVRGEVQKVAGEVREEKVREQQEAQMADHQLSWLKDSAQVTHDIMYGSELVNFVMTFFRLKRSWSRHYRSLSRRQTKWPRHRRMYW